MKHITMKPLKLHLTLKQIEGLDTITRETGLKRAEVVRRAIDLYLSTTGGVDERRTVKND